MGKKLVFNTNNTEDDLKLKGAYCIVNLMNGLCYIGSTTTTFRERWGSHLLELSKDNHSNKILQNDYNNYTINDFKFIILEECVNDNYLIEQKYIDLFNFNSLYNLCPNSADSSGYKQEDAVVAQKSKRYILIDPTNKIYDITNMREFCREHNLVQRHVTGVANNREKHYKHWLAYHYDEFFYDKFRQDRVNLIPKVYRLYDPNGDHYVVSNVRQFALEHDLEDSCLFNVLAGVRKTHKGWEIEYCN